MSEAVIAVAIGFGLALLQIVLFWKLRSGLPRIDLAPVLAALEALRLKHAELEGLLRDEFSRNRQEQATSAGELRREVVSAIAQLGESVAGKIESSGRVIDQRLEAVRASTQQHLDAFAAALQRSEQAFREGQDRFQTSVDTKLSNFAQATDKKLSEVMSSARLEADRLRNTVEERLRSLQAENEKKLEQMRHTVEEKLQGTLEARLGESFRLVSERLEKVYEGLGAMQALAAGVGDLKRVLSNVSTRGAWGEVQLGALLEQMLSPQQYGRNVSPTGSQERVEYAIRLPGDSPQREPVWLPIDAKFPLEDYRRLVEACENSDAAAADRARRGLEATIRRCAKTISEKYISPPHTTDFGILFLPAEGLYAEAVRRPDLAESIQRDHRIVLAGPSTLAALLNSLQIGFRTLAIQQRSSEVWQLLGAVKTDFGKFTRLLEVVGKKLSEAQQDVESAQRQSAKIHQRLGQVESAGSEPELKPLLAATADGEVIQDWRLSTDTG